MKPNGYTTGVGRIDRSRRTRLAALALVALAFAAGLSLPAPARAAALQLTCGQPKKDGGFTLILIANGDTASFAVGPILGTDSAVDKATKITNNLNNLGLGLWRAVRNGASITFQHMEGGVWKDVKTIQIFEDSTGEVTTWNALAAVGGTWKFRLTPGAATGTGAGGPDVVSCVTNGGSASVNVTAGMQASSIMDALYADLLADGVPIQRTGATEVTISKTSPSAFVQYQCTDTGLYVQASSAEAQEAASSVPMTSGIGLVAIALGLVGVVVWRRSLTRLAATSSVR